MIEGNFPISIQYLLKSGKYLFILPSNIINHCISEVNKLEIAKNLEQLQSFIEALKREFKDNPNLTLSDPFNLSVHYRLQVKEKPLLSLIQIHLTLAKHHEVEYYIPSKNNHKISQKLQAQDMNPKLTLLSLNDFFQGQVGIEFDDLAKEREKIEFYFIDPKVEKETVHDILPDNSILEILKLHEIDKIIPKKELLERLHLSQRAKNIAKIRKLQEALLRNEEDEDFKGFDSDFKNTLIQWDPLPSITRVFDIIKDVKSPKRQKYFLDSTYIAHLLQDFSSKHALECDQIAKLADNGTIFACLPSTLGELRQR
ncbi:MAG: hypothetical protein ACTSXP_06065, partial [Promethearchaeota archaeon]